MGYKRSGQVSATFQGGFKQFSLSPTPPSQRLPNRTGHVQAYTSRCHFNIFSCYGYLSTFFLNVLARTRRFRTQANSEETKRPKGGIIAIISYKSLGLSRTHNAISTNPLPCPCFFSRQCNAANLILAHHPAPPYGIIVLPVSAEALPQRQQQQQQQETNNLAMQPPHLYLKNPLPSQRI